MQSTAVFFGGLAVGGILAAACGFDLFPEERGERRSLEVARAELREAKAVLSRTQEGCRRAEGRVAELEARLASPAGSQPGGSGLERQLAGSTADADRLRSESARLGAELQAERAAAQASQAENRRLRRDVLEQILDFFAIERGTFDAGLATRFLATDASKEEKQALILELIKRNKELLLALPHPESLRAAALEHAAAREPGGLGAVVPVGPAAPVEPADPAGVRLEGR